MEVHKKQEAQWCQKGLHFDLVLVLVRNIIKHRLEVQYQEISATLP